MNKLLRRLAVAAAVLAALYVTAWWFLGRGESMPDRTAAPLFPGSAIEVVADLALPPGNIAVSDTGRVFFSFHPEGAPLVKVAEIVDGKPSPFPSEEWQRPAPGIPYFQTPLAVRIDRQNRLWVLDPASYATGTPRILAFALDSRDLVYQYDFPNEVAGFGSMLNDFQVDPAGERIYIAEASPFLHTPAIVVLDVAAKKSRRVLDGDRSLMPERYLIRAGGREMVMLGVYALRIGVDTIALDRTGEWLYFGPVNGDRLYRARADDLVDESLAPETLASRVEDYSEKTLSDGGSTDADGNVYLTDMEHDAILRVTPRRELQTLVKDRRLRWPDGLSFGPDGWLYVTCSALHQVILKSESDVRAAAPYQIYRFKPGSLGVPGH